MTTPPERTKTTTKQTHKTKTPQRIAHVKGTIILGDTLNIFHDLTPTHCLGKGH